MPIYDFQCACGFRFERSGRIANREKPAKCKSCGADASRIIPEDVAGVFVQKVQKGPQPQNTGLASFDGHVDRVIGSSAEDGWAFQEGRDKVKREVLRQNPGTKNSDLSKNVDGTWDVMPAKVKQRTYRSRLINEAALASGKHTNNDSY